MVHVVSRAASADVALQPTCSLQLVLLDFSMGYIADNKMIVRHFPLLRTTLSRDFAWTSLNSAKHMQALKHAPAEHDKDSTSVRIAHERQASLPERIGCLKLMLDNSTEQHSRELQELNAAHDKRSKDYAAATECYGHWMNA